MEGKAGHKGATCPLGNATGTGYRIEAIEHAQTYREPGVCVSAKIDARREPGLEDQPCVLWYRPVCTLSIQQAKGDARSDRLPPEDELTR